MAVRLAPEVAPIALGEKGRILLGRLLLEPGVAVSTDALADALWEDEPRADRRNGVQAAVKAVRKLLGDTASPRRIVVRAGDGYRIAAADPLLIDAERFRLLVARSGELADRLPRAARAMLAEALAIWHGRLLGEHADLPWAAGHARELDSLRDDAEVRFNAVRLALGEHSELEGTLRRQIVEHPHDERRRAQLVRALDGAGRAAEAGLAYRDAFRQLGALGPALRLLGDRIGRGLPADEQRPPAGGLAAGRSGGLLLCAILEPDETRSAQHGIGTLALIVDRHGGEPDPAGAGRLIATFADPRRALRAAQAMAAATRLRPAVGLHAGAVVQLGNRAAGPGPARAWQLAGAAHPGQILVSASARARIDPPTELRDLGVQVFEDLAPGEPLFELQPSGARSRQPHTLNRMPHNLPVQPTRFIGRDAELVRLSRLVAGGELLTLVGAGGCGKTRLALALAARCIARFDDGAWFVGLAELEHEIGLQDVAATVSHQLAVRAVRGETPAAALVRHLSGRAALLVLDNCEQIHEPCGELAALLRGGCPKLCIIATSRRRLRVEGERVAPVPPMATDATAEPDALSDAVELLLERAGPLASDVTTSADALIDAARICRALDGLPLAIELAAGQVTTRGLAGVAVEVEAMIGGDRGLDYFVADDPSRHPRQRTIEAAIAWSYALLSRCEQRALRALSVFRGTFGLREAQLLIAGPELDFRAAADVLGRLVEYSTVAPVPPLAGAARLRLVEPIRAFALRELERAGGIEATRDEHARVFATIAADIAPRLFGPEEQASLERLEADHDNLRAALAWFVERRRGDDALALVGKLWWLWFSHGHLAEGTDWVRRATAIDGRPSRERVRALRAGSHLAWWRGDYAQSDAYNLALEACARAVADAWGLAWAPMGHGAVQLFRDPRKSLPLFEESKRRFEALGRDWEAGYALQVVGGARWFAGDEPAALEAFSEAVEIFGRLSHRSVLASVQRSAGLMAARCGRPDRGAALCRAALATSTAIADRAGSAQALNFLAAISRDEGELETALARYADALVHAHEIGELWATCWALDGIAGLARTGGEPDLAARLLACSGALAAGAGYMQSPYELGLRERDLELLLDELGAGDFERATTDGELLPIGDAVSSALAFATRDG
ncbi:MAG TPA: BTAD domain-containing putative transcriptional regulator [Solirubrobacteraceae bacterium]|nr:BTAD domain-containing putative transcriptional regulator [Solirubrobacteraceae bacterium]